MLCRSWRVPMVGGSMARFCAPTGALRNPAESDIVWKTQLLGMRYSIPLCKNWTYLITPKFEKNLREFVTEKLRSQLARDRAADLLLYSRRLWQRSMRICAETENILRKEVA